MNTEQVYRDLSRLVRDENCIVRDALMKNYTTFRIGGPADLLIQPSSEEELIRIAAYLRQKDISAVVLGNGSNVLVKDGGIRGVVRELGFAHTVLHNPLHFDRYRRLGTTTPRDYAALFARIAKGELVSREASAEMLAILRQQHYNTMLTHDFPQFYLDCEETGEPELIWVASKSGSMNACRNDGGIVHTPYGEYVIVLMNKDFHDIIEYNEHPAMVYGARVSRMILDQVLACEGRLSLS